MFGFLTLTPDLTITAWSAWLAELTGRPESGVLGRGLWQVFPELEERGLAAALQQALESGAPRTLSHSLHRYVFPAADGRPVAQSAQVQPVLEGGRVVALTVVVQDVSDRTATESDLESQVRQLQAQRRIDDLTLSGDYDGAFEAIVRECVALFDALHAAVMRLEHDHLAVRAVHGVQEPPVVCLGEGIVGAVAQSGQPARVLDVSTDPRYLLADPRTRAEMAVPLIAAGRTLGVLNVESATPASFVGDALDRLQTLAGAAALALHAEQSRSREQRRLRDLNLLRELALRLTTAAALQAIYDLSVEYAVRLLDASAASLCRYDPDAGRAGEDHAAVFTFVAGPGLPGLPRQPVATPRPGGLAQVVATTGEPLVVNDPASHPLYGPARAEEMGVQAIAGMPLERAGRVIAVLVVSFSYPHRISTAELSILALLVEQISAHIEAAELRDADAERLATLEALYRLTTTLRTAHTHAEIQGLILDEVMAFFDGDAAAIVYPDPDGQRLRVVGGRGWAVALSDIVYEADASIVGRVLRSGEPYRAADLRRDPYASHTATARFADKVRAGIYAPLRIGPQVIGVLFIGADAPRRFTDADLNLLTTLAELAGAALHRSELHEQTRRQLRRMEALHAIERTINASMELNLTLSVILDEVTVQLGVDAAAVLLRHSHTHTLEHGANRGFRTDAVTRSRLPMGRGYAGRAALERKLVSVPDLAAAEPPFGRARMAAAEAFVAYYATPLVAKGKVRGVLEIFHRSALEPEADWLDFLEMLAGQAATAIDNATLFSDLQRSNAELTQAYDTTLKGWARALEMRDLETEGHSWRVSEWTLGLAQALGMSEQELVHTGRGALLHDIGKMGVPDDILLKPGPLDDREWAIMRQHPTYAYEMLSPITFLRPATDIPRYHHEKWDGSGYPQGLRGEGIPLAARVFAVVDVWDALRSDRPYRKAWPEENVREYIRAQAGAHFDPRVAEAFLNLVQ